MKKYKITGKILLSFIRFNEQHDYLLDNGYLEAENNTVWYITTEGIKHESITTANIIDVALQRNDIEEI